MTLYGAVEKGLKDLFPGTTIDVMPRDYESRLICAVDVRGEKIIWMTPQGMDCRSLSAPEWIHRFAAEIRKKLP